MTITSPIKGHVTRKYQRVGNFVEEGTPLYDVAELSTVWVLAQVYEADQALLHEGMTVRATTLSLPGVRLTLWLGAAIILSAGALALRAYRGTPRPAAAA